MIEFVYFDLGKVILNFSHEQACRQMADVSGASVDAVRKLLFEEDLEERYETGLIDSAQFHEEFCKATASNPPIKELLIAGSDIFSLNHSIVPIINGLSTAGIRIGILSNTCAAHWEFVIDKYTLLQNCFEQTILSYEVKSMKPDSKIYSAAIQQAAVEPQQIFFMDDKAENVEGAKAAGIQAVLFRSADELGKQLQATGLKFSY